MIRTVVHAEESFKRIHEMLSGVPGGAEKAMRGVISRAAATARKTALQGITSVYDIKQKDVRDRKNTTINIRTKKTEDGIVGEILYSSKKIPLYRFNATPKAPTPLPYKVRVIIGGQWLFAHPGAPVKAHQRKDTPMKTFDNAFIAEMKNGHIGMFERKNKRSSEITEFMGSSTAQMAEDSGVLSKVEEAVMETIVKRTEHEITRILRGYGGNK